MTILEKWMISMILLPAAMAADGKFQEIFGWKAVELEWPSEEKRTRAYERNEYIAANNQIAGIKIWKDKIYLTIPRWREGVPVTLCVTSMRSPNITDETPPKLDAYPTWDMQRIDDCRAFQFVRSMEIDPLGRMWVLDTGRTEIMTLEPKSRCPPRLVILDLEDQGQVLRSYNFPEDVASPNASYLNDIVVDHEDGGYAYITDNSDVDPGIIVFSLGNRTSWKIRDLSMRAQTDAVKFTVGGVDIVRGKNVDGIALSSASSRDRYVFYAPLSSYHLYALPTWVLKNPPETVHNYVNDAGKKDSQTDGMIMSSTGTLYYGLLANDSIGVWDARPNFSFTIGQDSMAADHAKMRWPDTFAFDEIGHLYCVASSLQNFITERVNSNVVNYRVMRLETPGVKNYQYYADGTAPELPVIIAGVERPDLMLSVCLAAAFVAVFVA